MSQLCSGNICPICAKDIQPSIGYDFSFTTDEFLIKKLCKEIRGYGYDKNIDIFLKPLYRQRILYILRKGDVMCSFALLSINLDIDVIFKPVCRLDLIFTFPSMCRFCCESVLLRKIKHNYAISAYAVDTFSCKLFKSVGMKKYYRDFWS